MKNLITFHDNNGKLAIYIGENIHRLYRYIEMIGIPTKLTSSGQRSNYFGDLSYTDNDTVTLHPVI